MKKILLLLLVFVFAIARTDSTKFVVVVASYNNAKWYLDNIKSILSQDYSDYRIIIVDDGSRDGTGNFIEKFLKERKVDFTVVSGDYDAFDASECRAYVDKYSALIRTAKESHKVVLVKNLRRKLALHNLVLAFYACRDNEVLVEVDGDDILAHHDVLKCLNDVYRSGNIWLTYGQFKNLSDGQICGWNLPVPRDIIRNNAYRRHPHLPTHLRTFYAGLFKKIKLQDLLLDGDFYDMTWDVAFMMPMLEMAGGRFKFIPDVLLVYNDLNDLNDHKKDQKKQLRLSKYIRSLSPYAKLPSLS